MPNRPSARQVLPFVLVAMGVIILLGVGLYLLNPLGAAGRLPELTPSPAISAARLPYPEVPRISLGDAKAALDTRQAVFIDVRGEPYYSQEHIPGALNISGDDLSSRLNELDKAAWIITYCT